MSDEIVVFNDVNPYTGLRGLLVKRAGGPVDLAKWMDIVPETMRGRVTFDAYEMEQGMFTWHHLRMDWATREFIYFEADDSRIAAIEGWKQRVTIKGRTEIPAVAWTLLDQGERMSGAMRSAAELYFGALDRYPKFCLVRGLPKDAPKTLTLPSPLEGEGCEMKIVQADWVWRKMIVVL